MHDLFALPSSAAIYEALGKAIDEIAPKVTAGSTLQDDLNLLRVERRQLWMRLNHLGPRNNRVARPPAPDD